EREVGALLIALRVEQASRVELVAARARGVDGRGHAPAPGERDGRPHHAVQARDRGDLRRTRAEAQLLARGPLLAVPELGREARYDPGEQRTSRRDVPGDGRGGPLPRVGADRHLL